MELDVMDTARVRGISEGDEDLIAALDSLPSSAERATALLARCVVRLGDVESPGVTAVRNLALGTREGLLLEVRRMTFGETIECMQKCPACQEIMVFDLRVEDLLQLGAVRPRERYEEVFLTNGMEFRIVFRVPTGADLEAAAAVPRGHSAEGVKVLLTRCIEEVGRGGDPVEPSDLPPALVDRLSERMSELDLLAEIRMPLVCPKCGHTFDSFFDSGEYLLRELETWQKKLYHDVHRIALAYHWREEDILRMKPRKRKIYLDLLAQEPSDE